MATVIRGMKKVRSFPRPGGGIIPFINSEDRDKIRFSYLVLPFFIVLLMSTLIFSIPFFLSDGFEWSYMNVYFQGLLFCLFAALICHAYLSFRFGNTMLLLGISFLVSYAAESSGIQWGWPFCSRYHYNPALIPILPGGVPLFIPLSWFMLSYSALRFLRPFPILPGNSMSIKQILLKALLCAVYITAIDLVIDPIAILYGVWFWHEQGIYFGIPPGNFIGWFIISFGICSITLLLERPSQDKYFDYSLVPDLIFVLLCMLLTILFFIKCTIRLGSFLPVFLALILLGPIWVFSVVYARHSLNKQRALQGKGII